jgi:hypothetical protein
MINIFPVRNSQKGIAHLLLLVLLIAGIGLGLYLVQNKTNLFPFASNELSTPETSFQLESNKTSVKAGEEFKVNLMVRSDFDAANTFSALVSYPADKVEVVRIDPSPESTSSAVLSDIEPVKEDNSLLSGIFDSLWPKAEAQSSMPPLSGVSVCLGDTPRVALSWNSDLNPDVLNWDIYREPPFVGYPSAFVGNYALPFSTPKVGRTDFPLLTQGDPGGTYTYYLGGSGQSNKVTVTNNTVCSNNSQLIEAVVPAQVQPGAQFNVKYVFKNNGTRVWPSSQFSFPGDTNKAELKLVSGTPFTPGSNELKKTVGGIALSIYPGQNYAFEFPVTAPAEAGTYDFNWQMSLGGSNFGETSLKKITVGSPVSPSPSQAVSPTPTPTPNLIFFITKWVEQADNKKRANKTFRGGAQSRL